MDVIINYEKDALQMLHEGHMKQDKNINERAVQHCWVQRLRNKKKQKRKKKGIRSLPRIVACYLGKTMSNADAARNEWMLSRYRRCPTEKQKFNHAQIYLRIDTYHAGIADEDSIQSHR